MELWNYGARTWVYIHGRLKLPIEYTMIKIIENRGNTKFLVINPIWNSYPKIRDLGEINAIGFTFSHTHPNPFTKPHPRSNQLLVKSWKESMQLRNCLINWLKGQKEAF